MSKLRYKYLVWLESVGIEPNKYSKFDLQQKLTKDIEVLKKIKKSGTVMFLVEIDYLEWCREND